MPASSANPPGAAPTAAHTPAGPGVPIRASRSAASGQVAALHRTTVFKRLAALHGHAFARLADERGAATAEYAVATMAAVGFAGLLVVLLRGDEVRGILTDLVRNALTVG